MNLWSKCSLPHISSCSHTGCFIQLTVFLRLRKQRNRKTPPVSCLVKKTEASPVPLDTCSASLRDKCITYKENTFELVFLIANNRQRHNQEWKLHLIVFSRYWKPLFRVIGNTCLYRLILLCLSIKNLIEKVKKQLMSWCQRYLVYRK